MFIIDDLLLSPIKLCLKIAERIRDMAEEELYGEDRIKEELLRLQLRLETGEITDQQYKEAEDALMDRLEEAARRKQGEG
jgi:hypothetical protein